MREKGSNEAGQKQQQFVHVKEGGRDEICTEKHKEKWEEREAERENAEGNKVTGIVQQRDKKKKINQQREP